MNPRCKLCRTVFPSIKYVDIYNVCHIQECQDRKNKEILQGNWFFTKEEQKLFEDKHQMDAHTEAIAGVILKELDGGDDVEFYAAMRGVITHGSKLHVIELIINKYKELVSLYEREEGI